MASGLTMLIVATTFISTAGAMGASAAVGEGDELVSLVNGWRDSPQTCEGRRTVPAAPLSPHPALSRVRPASGEALDDALREAGYLAARAHVITISGPASARAAMAFIEQHYCRVLSSPLYAQIGISREANTWRIVLAQPLLSADLGDWMQAGKEVLELTNAARAKARACGGERFGAAPALAWNARLAAAALAHSRDMARRNYFSHSAKNGNRVGDRARQEGYAWRRIGENIAAGQGSAEQAVSAWLASPSHCAILMSGSFSDMGAAYAINSASDTPIYWTQVFGRPR